MILRIEPNGQIKTIYSDSLLELDLSDHGTMTTERASHVEPQGSQWTADMAPVGGPILGPYTTRSEALSEEVKWLTANVIRQNGRGLQSDLYEGVL